MLCGAIEVLDEEYNKNKHNGSEVREDWRRWCRLCAKVDKESINILTKNEYITTNGNNKMEVEEEHNELRLSWTIVKYFDVQISPHDQFPILLCTECFALMESLKKFSERVARVQEMYDELQHCQHSSTQADLQALRLRYGVLEEDRPHDLIYYCAPGDISLYGGRGQLTINNCDGEKKCIAEEAYIVATELQEPSAAGDIKKENSSNDFIINQDEDEEDVLDYDENEYADDGEDPFGSDADENSKAEDDDQIVNDESENNVTIKTETSLPKEKKIIKTKTKSVKMRKANVENIEEGESLASDEQCANDGERRREKLFRCVECCKTFKRPTFYRLHMERKHAKTDAAVPCYSCTQCALTFNTRNQLSHHHTIKHKSIAERRIIPCPYCKQKFPTKTYVAQHIKFVHMNERPFICEECGVAMRSMVQLKLHMLTHTDYAPFECEVCKKCFKNQDRLKNHMEIHNPNKHICAECGLQLNSRVTLNRHLLVHSDVMQHKCDYCGRAFKRAKALKNHLILHTGLKPYTCDFCDRTFANGSNCRTHKRKAHPEELAAQEAAGGKTNTPNIPKLAVLKSVTQAGENLAPVVSKLSGNFAFGKKPQLSKDSIGIFSKKKRQKLFKDNADAKSAAAATATTTTTPTTTFLNVELSASPNIKQPIDANQPLLSQQLTDAQKQQQQQQQQPSSQQLLPLTPQQVQQQTIMAPTNAMANSYHC